jgi:CDP-4-dehydro-6-deoxyglucose reductase
MPRKIQVEPSGHQFEAGSEERVLDAALRAGLGFPYGCRDGECGSCRGKVLAGHVEYPNGWPPALSEQEAEEGYALFCQALASSDLTVEVREVESVAGIRPRKMPCRVARIEHLAHDVVRLCLKLPEKERLQFLAGQYIDFILRDGRRRAFSLANAPHDDVLLELHIRYVEGGQFTDYVFKQLKEKAILRFEGPLGSFCLREESQRPILFVGGGTGFAPLKGMIEHAFARGIRRAMHLYWGVRSRRDLYLAELPLSWERDHAKFRYTPVLSEPRPDDHWDGRVGWVHEALLADYPDLTAHEVYMSGPPAMIQVAREAFLAHGLAQENLFFDSFEYAADKR